MKSSNIIIVIILIIGIFFTIMYLIKSRKPNKPKNTKPPGVVVSERKPSLP